MLSNSQNQNPQVLFPNPPPPPPLPLQPQQQQPQLAQQQQFPQFHIKSGLQIKKNAITDDYKVTTQVLGLGINGKVLEIFNKRTAEKFALKVSIVGPPRLYHPYLFQGQIQSCSNWLIMGTCGQLCGQMGEGRQERCRHLLEDSSK